MEDVEQDLDYIDIDYMDVEDADEDPDVEDPDIKDADIEEPDFRQEKRIEISDYHEMIPSRSGQIEHLDAGLLGIFTSQAEGIEIETPSPEAVILLLPSDHVQEVKAPEEPAKEEKSVITRRGRSLLTEKDLTFNL